MKIGVLTTSFPRRDGDSAGAFVLGFARALAARGHTIEVLAPEPNEADRPPAWPGIEVRWVPYVRPRALERTFYGAGAPDNVRVDPLAWIGAATFGPALLVAARDRARSWDALVSHWALPSALVGGLVARSRPHLAVTHGADLSLLERVPGGSVLARRVARGASAMTFVSGLHRDRFLSLLPTFARADAAGRCHVSPMGIEPPVEPSASRADLRRALGLDRFTVLSLGRLVPIKGLDDAICALTPRSDGAPIATEILVAGDGPERNALERLARARGLRARFVGEVRGAAKRDLFAAADAFVLPSRPLASGRDEGVPTALLEAMACGMPIVATRTGGVASVADDEKSALLVPPGEPLALGHAIMRIASDAKLARRLGRSAARTARAYTWPSLAPRFESLVISR